MFRRESGIRRTLTALEVAPLTLHIKYVKAYTTQDKSKVKAVRKMRFDRNWTIKKALAVMSTEGRMTQLEGKSLYYPNPDRKIFGTWLHPDKTFADYGVKDMVPRLSHIYCYSRTGGVLLLLT